MDLEAACPFSGIKMAAPWMAGSYLQNRARLKNCVQECRTGAFYRPCGWRGVHSRGIPQQRIHKKIHFSYV